MLGIFKNDQPTVEIEVKGVRGKSKNLTALIDSGFNGYLQIPFTEAFPLGLVLGGVEDMMLADGSSASNLICNGTVCMDSTSIETNITISQGNIVLLGTKLLKKLEKILILNCALGRVEIIDII